MLDLKEYSIDSYSHQGNGHGYDKLQGDWASFYKVAKGFVKRVKPEDRQDFLHDLLLTMARVKSKYDSIGKPLTEAGLVRIACFDTAEYWRQWFKSINGTDYGRCSTEQRRKCKDWYLYPDCPKAVKMERLDKLVHDGNGDSTPLHEMIADDSAVDVVARLDARHILQGYPHRFVKLAYKRYCGLPLDELERKYFNRQKHKAMKSQQKVLV